jgi:cytochrome c heme-lyase
MSTVVAIHNAVNERAWQHILAWERLHACDCPDPKLLRFRGRPSEFSPKARLLNLLVRPPRAAGAARAPAAAHYLPRCWWAGHQARAAPHTIATTPLAPRPSPATQGYKLPFDRHDWFVDRCGREVRYVIDFYSGTPQAGAQASMHLDVRPALDSFSAALDRARMQWQWVLSGRWQEP